MRHLVALLAVILAVSLTGVLSAGEDLPPGTHDLKMAHDGLTRVLRLHIPPQARAGQKLPLVLGLHGGGGNPRQFARASGFETIADREGFVVAFPGGTSPRFESFLLTWNSTHCCGSALARDVDDVGFLAKVLDEVPERTPIDLDRVYMVGHSNGAMMTLRAAGFLSERLAAIASLAGSIGGQAKETLPVVRSPLPHHPVSGLFLHGRLDQHVKWEGGLTEGVGRGRIDLSVDETVGSWVKALQCDPQERLERWDDGLRLEHVHGDCRGGAEVRLVELTDHGHSWLGDNVGRVRRYLMGRAGQPTTKNPNLVFGERIWEFFRDKHR